MKRILLCLGLALAVGVPTMCITGCSGTGWRVGIYGVYDICPRCGGRHAPGNCPDDNWNRPQWHPRYNPPRYVPPHCDPPRHEEHHEHHGGHGCR